jgi:hypothetical protein
MDLLILVAQGTGLVLFIKGILMWLSLMRSRSSSPMMGQMFSAPPPSSYIVAVFVAATFMWKFGEGIAFWGSLWWHGTGLDFSTPYSTAMFDDISQRTTNLVNLTSVGNGTDNTQIAIRAVFAIMAIFGAVSYFRGIMGITYLSNPQMAGKTTFGQVAVHMIFGILLVYTNYFYVTLTNTFASSMS